jgi:Arc/MetJ family transcription regulator
MTDPRELVEQLRSFRTRKAAMEALMETGGGAVDALIEALDARNEGVRWAAIRCLGEIGDAKAVRELIRRLGDPLDRDAAAEALRRITGQDLAADAEAWHRWSGEGAPPPSSQASPAGDLPDDALVAEAVRGLSASIQGSGHSRTITIRLEGGRRQVVRISLSAKDLDGEPVALVYSECGPADPAAYEYALRLNLSIPYGALALREVEGAMRLVMLNSLLRRGLTPLALRKSILAIASKADSVEQRLFGRDRC